MSTIRFSEFNKKIDITLEGIISKYGKYFGQI